ncbi:MAG: Do family serine endopeptidase [Sphingomonas sp.]|nr:Do family serine endopeptidase [Sphingomonas sp.]
MRYAYALIGALVLGGTAATMTLEHPAGAQTAQNDPATMAAVAPRAGAPLSFADLVAKLQPAVVNISTKQSVKIQAPQNPFAGTPFAELFGGNGQGGGAPVTRKAQSLGSGFLISPDGFVVTNNHVVAPGAQGASVDSITVILTDGKEYTAKLVGRDAASDLALLKIDATNLPFVRWGDSTKARVGDWIVAIGNPFGIGSTVTAGIVSALHRATGLGAYDRFIQTDAAINQGNSGGPMFDLNGNVIGINSQIYTPSQGSVGIGFAIPSEVAKPVIDTLMKGQTVKRGYLGVGPQPLDEDVAAALGLPKNSGEIIRSVSPGEAADKSGIKVGDVVVSVNGKPVNQDQSLSFLVAGVTPGTRVPFELIRQGKRMTLQVTVGTRPSEEALQAQIGGNDADGAMTDQGDSPAMGPATTNKLGLSVQTLTPQIARQLGIDSSVQGVVINNVDQSSDAGQKLQRGDVILSANGVAVTTPEALAGVVQQVVRDGKSYIALLVQRGRNPPLFVGIGLRK